MNTLLNDSLFLLVSGPVGRESWWVTLISVILLFAGSYLVTHSIISLVRRIIRRVTLRNAIGGAFTSLDNLFPGDPYYVIVRVRADLRAEERAEMDGSTYAVNSFMAGLRGEQVRLLRCLVPGTRDTYHYVMQILTFDNNRHIRAAARYIWHPSWLEILDERGNIPSLPSDNPKDVNFFNA